MNLFRRAVRTILFLTGLVVGIVVGLAAFFSRQMLRPQRQILWANPRDAGLPYEDVEFPARDGLRLSGWFLPAGDNDSSSKPTLILVHNWLWNRLGEAADTLMGNISGALPVDMLRLGHALHQAGFHILMVDHRNHGESAEGGAVTFGLQESNDVLGAVDYLQTRPDVDKAHVGVVGFGMGANATLFALPHAESIGAAVAVQPASPSLFAERYAADLFGPLGKPVVALTELIYRQLGQLPLRSIEPLLAVSAAQDMPVLYVQGNGDRWGSVSNVAQMVERTPGSTDPLFIDTHHRYGGYRYIVQNPEVLTAFFMAHFS